MSAPVGLRQLGGVSSSPQTPKSVVTDDFDDLDDLDDFEEDDDDDDSGFSRRRILFAIAGFALVILLIVVVFGVLPRSNTTPEATNVAQAATDTSIILPTITDSAIIEATTDTVIAVTPEPSAETIGTTPTIELVRAETETPADDLSETIVAPDVTPSSAALDGFYSALSGFAVTPDSVAVEETSLGQTLSATVCLQNQGELRNAIPSAISAMASASGQAPDEAQFMGVKFINCADNSLLRYVAVPVADARAFADGSLTEAQLRAVQSNITR